MKQHASSAANVVNVFHSARKKHEAGLLGEAEKGYQRVLSIDESHAEAWHMLGVIALQSGRLQDAVSLISRALGLRAEYPEALNNLGSVLLAMGQLEQAEKLMRMALKVKPDYADALSNLGGLLNTLGRYEEALPVLERAVEINPRAALAQNNLGNVYRDMGNLVAAEAAYRKAHTQDRKNPLYAAVLGRLLMQRGEHKQSVELFNQALKTDQACIPALCGLAASKKISPESVEVDLFRRAAGRVPALSLRDQIDFMFAWGKLHDDIGDYDNAFACLREANRLRRLQRPYSLAIEEAIADAIIAGFTREFISSFEASGSTSEVPVFIVGMPRSGTTLTEQIISSHPRVHGAGELKFINDIVSEFIGLDSAERVKQGIGSLTPEKLTVMGDRYVDRVCGEDAGAGRITDKMPANFWYLGLIRLIAPNARIIHVRRNPVDTCLSCYQQDFAEGQGFSNDLTDLGHYYGLYRRMMAHWHEVMPGQIHDVDYESLVNDPDVTVRRLIEHVGLEWDDACLRPDENRRVVRTASQWQVRQPVHTQSVERWRRYETHLGPLVQALRDAGVETGA